MASPMKGLVSLVVPCYDVEPYIQRFFDSLVAQTYRNLEIILVDDGSTDQTSEIIRENVPRLEAEGFRVISFRQANRGLAGAVDSGLRHVSGEFLTWPDPDDWLTPDSIAGRVELMREHPEAAVLRSNAEIFIDAEGVKRGAFLERGDWVRPAAGLFEKLLFASTFYAPVCHMVRSARFFEVYPEREIYVPPNASQNIQMLLPLVERFPVIETARCFAVWRKRSDSRSQRAKTPADLIPRFEMLHDISRHVTGRLVRDPALARKWTDQNFYRNKLLPTAFEGRMRDRALNDLREAELPWPRAVAARCLIHAWCRSGTEAAVEIPGKTASLLTRIFRRVVRFKYQDKFYPAANGRAPL